MRIRTKKRIAATVGAVAFLAMLCIVGGSEWGDIPVLRAGVLAALCELVGAAAWWKAGILCHRW